MRQCRFQKAEGVPIFSLKWNHFKTYQHSWDNLLFKRVIYLLFTNFCFSFLKIFLHFCNKLLFFFFFLKGDSMALIVDVPNLLQFQKVHKDKIRRRKNSAFYPMYYSWKKLMTRLGISTILKVVSKKDNFRDFDFTTVPTIYPPF